MRKTQEQDAYASGMRGGEKPKEKEKKRGVRRISIEAAKTGHIIEVERHPKKPGKDGMPLGFEPPERHAHNTKQSAMAHVNDLMDEMSSSGDGY